jgi:hypothetical protein
VTQQRKLPIAVLGFMALFALYGTWSQNLAYFAGGGGPRAFAAFVLDTKVNPASRSLGVDISVVFYAASVFMVLEARRLGVRFVWAYVVFGILVAISVTFPLFLIARELRLAKAPAALKEAKPTIADVIGLAVLTLITLSLSIFIIT